MSAGPAQGEPQGAVDEAHRLVAAATDELAAAREDLRSTQAAVELLLEVAGPLAIVEDGTVRGWSRRLEELTGITTARAVGRPVDPQVFGEPTWVDPEGRTWDVRRHGGGRGFEALVLSPAT